MPDRRTTILTKKKVRELRDGDFIKIGGRWYALDGSMPAMSLGDRQHLHFYPEGSDHSSERISFFVNPLVKFKVRTPK